VGHRAVGLSTSGTDSNLRDLDGRRRTTDTADHPSL
jgi:hypothetical protein